MPNRGKNRLPEEDRYAVDTENLKGKLTLPLAVVAFAAAFGSSVPHGWNSGVINTPADIIRDFINGSYTEHFGDAAEEDTVRTIWSVTVSVYLAGGFLGASTSGWLADKLGRKKALMMTYGFGIVSAVLFGLCQLANSFEMFIVGRFIVGIGCGSGSGIVPLYLTEIAPINMRGAMGTLHQFGLTLGILLSQILGNETLLPVLLAMTAVPCIVSFVIMIFFPDSPRHLLVNKGDEETAVKALRIYRGKRDVKHDVDEMLYEQQQQKSDSKWSFKDLVKSRILRIPLAIVCISNICQQLSGINVVFYYSTSVFQDAGIPPQYIQYAVLGTGVMNVLITGISVWLVDRCGRRPLLLGGILCMVIISGLLTAALKLQATVTAMRYVSIVCVIAFVIAFSVGLGSIPMFLASELFKQGPRPTAVSLGGFLNWLCNFLVAIGFPHMANAMGAYSFLVFMGCLISCGLFLAIFLPETKNKTYESIYRHFDKSHKMESPPSTVEATNPLINGKHMRDETSFGR